MAFGVAFFVGFFMRKLGVVGRDHKGWERLKYGRETVADLWGMGLVGE